MFKINLPSPSRTRKTWVPVFSSTLARASGLKNNSLRLLAQKAKHPAVKEAAEKLLARREAVAKGEIFLVSKTAATEGRSPFGLPAGAWRLIDQNTAERGVLAEGQPRPIWMDRGYE